MSTSLETYIQLDKRIDAAEERSAGAVAESLRERWEFGRLLLAERKGKQLPKGRLDELVEATGKSRIELQLRAQFAERYPTEDEVFNALNTCESWRQMIASLPKPKPDDAGKPPKPTSPPRPHKKRREMVDLENQGVPREQIAKETGISEHVVRRELEREAIAREAEADTVVIDWSTVTGRAKEREAILRRAIRREVEAEFEPHVQAEVRARIDSTADLYTEYRRVLDARRGILTRTQFDLIRSCLHPDSRLSVSDEKLAQAFRIFNEAEILLLDETSFKTTTLPSFEELLKRKQAR